MGTVVELDSDERAIVLRQNEDARLIHRPVVAIVGKSGLNKEPINLVEQRDNGTGDQRSMTREVYDEGAEGQKVGTLLSSSPGPTSGVGSPD